MIHIICRSLITSNNGGIRHCSTRRLRRRRRLDIEQLWFQRSPIEAVPTAQKQMVRIGPFVKLICHSGQKTGAFYRQQRRIVGIGHFEEQQIEPLKATGRAHLIYGIQDF